MARIDAVVSDDLVTQFKMMMVKRLGGKKGDFSKALEQAMKLWIKNDAIEKIKQKLLAAETNTDDFSSLVDSLKRQGKEALPSLLEIHDSPLTPDQANYVMKAIRDAPKY
jgi:ribbon-helix-helix protein